MIHMVDPRQNRLFDPFQGVIPPAGQRIIAEGWQGVFRHALLEVMPVGELAENFSRELGAPTKELYSMAGLVFLADFFGWTAQEAIEVYIFRSDVQYALNLEPGVTVSTRSVERYQKMFRDDELAISVFQDVTTRLAEKLELDITCQRLDSTHVFSHMASFGRTKLMAVAIKRFLTQVGVIAPVPGIMRLFWAFSSSNPPESPSQEDSSLANMLDTLEARCRSDGPPAGPRSIDPLPGSRSFLTVSAVA